MLLSVMSYGEMRALEPLRASFKWLMAYKTGASNYCTILPVLLSYIEMTNSVGVVLALQSDSSQSTKNTSECFLFCVLQQYEDVMPL